VAVVAQLRLTMAAVAVAALVVYFITALKPLKHQTGELLPL
jgi:uncharacterized protein YoxC